MADIAIRINDQTFEGDLALLAGDLVQGEELVTALYVSLFTETGWWANAYEADDWGCGLLGLRRARRGAATLGRAVSFARDALAWMIEDQVAQSVDVAAEYQGERLALRVRVTRAGATTRYDFVWGGV